jgi:2'-5' RNA ligase
MRLFVGLEIPDAIKAHVGLLTGGVAGARWQEPEQLHITLRFIGEVEGPRVADINAALGAITAPGFHLMLRGVDIFGEPAKPRMLWAGVEPTAPIQHLRDKVEQALVRTGLPAESRKFKPHLTLARFGREKPRRLADYLTGHAAFASASFPVTEFTLFESRLGHTGAVYVPLERYGLEG